MSERDIVMLMIGALGGYLYVRSQLDRSVLGRANQAASRYGFPLY